MYMVFTFTASSLTTIAAEILSFNIFLIIVACLITLISIKIILNTQLHHKSVKGLLRATNLAILPLQIIFILIVIDKFVTLF